MRVLLIALLVGVPSAGPPVTQTFDRVYLGEARGGLSGVAAAPDGGFYAAGYMASDAGPAECIVIRYDDKGRATWRKTLAESSKRANVCHRVTPMGEGALVAGYTTGMFSRQDAWVFALDDQARVRWKVIHGGNELDQARMAIPFHKDHVLAVGTTASKGAGATDGLVFLIDPRGGVRQEWTFGAGGYDVFVGAAETPDGGVALVGESPPDGKERSRPDAWVVKLDKDAGLIWEKHFGTPAREGATAVIALDDGTLLVAGTQGKLKDGKPVAPDGTRARADRNEGWIAHLDATGEVKAEFRLGHLGVRSVTDIHTYGADLTAVGTIVGEDGYYDGWLAGLGIDLKIRWNTRIGAEHHEYPKSVARTATGTLVLGGWFARKASFDIKPWVAGFTQK